MTLLAIRAELPPVNIGMAVRAFRADIGEYKLRMALYALYFFVHPPQRIAGLIMAEFGNTSDGLPAR